MTALLAKATALALVQHPAINASCKDGKSFTYNSSINIAVAVAMDGGLITPVLQDADKVNPCLARNCRGTSFQTAEHIFFLLCKAGYLFSLSEVERAC